MADTATPAKKLSTSNVTPQDRGFDSDYEHTVNFSFEALTSHNRSWFPGEKIRITKITMANGDTAQAASTNTTVLDIDSEDNAGAKVADIAAMAAQVVAADVAITLTLSTTEANLVIENTETVKMALTIAGTQGEFDLAISYKKLEVRDVPGTWPAS